MPSVTNSAGETGVGDLSAGSSPLLAPAARRASPRPRRPHGWRAGRERSPVLVTRCDTAGSPRRQSLGRLRFPLNLLTLAPGSLVLRWAGSLVLQKSQRVLLQWRWNVVPTAGMVLTRSRRQSADGESDVLYSKLTPADVNRQTAEATQCLSASDVIAFTYVGK